MDNIEKNEDNKNEFKDVNFIANGTNVLTFRFITDPIKCEKNLRDYFTSLSEKLINKAKTIYKNKDGQDSKNTNDLAINMTNKKIKNMDIAAQEFKSMTVTDMGGTMEIELGVNKKGKKKNPIRIELNDSTSEVGQFLIELSKLNQPLTFNLNSVDEKIKNWVEENGPIILKTRTFKIWNPDGDSLLNQITGRSSVGGKKTKKRYKKKRKTKKKSKRRKSKRRKSKRRRRKRKSKKR